MKWISECACPALGRDRGRTGRDWRMRNLNLKQEATDEDY